MRKIKAVERSRLRLTIDEKSVPTKQRRDEIIKEVCAQYGINLKKNIFIAEVSNPTLPGRVLYDVRIESSESGLPIVAALELFMMKMGNVMIYSRVMEYGIVR